MKKVIAIVAAIAIVALIAFRLSSNHKKINAKQNVSTDIGFVSVDVAEVKSIKLENELSLVGYLDPFREVNVAAEAQGSITMLNAELGQQVSQGSILALIDNRQKLLAHKTAQISVKKLEKDLARYKSLYQGGSATEQQLDEVQNSYDNAVIQEQQAAKQLADATVKSPISGIITKKFVEKGSFVNVGSSVATVIDIAQLKIKLNVSESNIYLLKLGDVATITTDILPAASFRGKVSYISPKGDEAHSYQVELLIPNNGASKLKAGTFVNVKFDLPAKAESLCIPRTALQGSDKDAMVYVAHDGIASLRKISVRGANNKYLEVLSGLKAGEKVVVSGQLNLTNGKAIKINK
jgi:RND family efflux transporter MFP subunit